MKNKITMAAAVVFIIGAGVFCVHTLRKAGIIGRPSASRENRQEYEKRKPQGYTYHWTKRKVYEAEKVSGAYMYPGWEFIPTTKTKKELEYFANDVLRNNTDRMVVLVIDETKVDPKMKFPKPQGPNAVSGPEIHGVLNLDAVVQVVPLERDNTGRYVLPEDTK